VVAVNFKPGDAVIIIAHPLARYPADALPGTVATIIKGCDCPLAMMSRYPYWEIQIPARCLCAVELVLKKIDPDGRQVIRWDWRELLSDQPVTSP
jgi:hypothetical protein